MGDGVFKVKIDIGKEESEGEDREAIYTSENDEGGKGKDGF